MIDYDSPLKFESKMDYGDRPRTELIGLIQEPPGHILEVGCSSGATGMAIKQKFPNVKYIGVDSDKESAEIAQTRLDDVIVADIDKVQLNTLGFKKESFDHIICADILEHLYDPWKMLFDLRDYLTPDGRIIASIPNVQHINNIINLMNGNWRYNVNGGLLDATHIRFFTLNEIVKMFNGTGYDIINCSGADPKLKSDKWPTDFDFGTFVLKNVTEKEASKFAVFQYFIIAQRNGKE